MLDHDTGKTAETLYTFFDLIGQEQCEGIETVTIDMSAAYEKAITERLPNATIIFDPSTEAAEPVPTLTSVSIDSNNAISSGTDEFATVGDTVTLSFTTDETIQTSTVSFTMGGTPAVGSVTVVDAVRYVIVDLHSRLLQ